MANVFTEYVRLLEKGGEPTGEDFDQVLGKLRDALKSEMIKKGLWSAPPSYLGILGWDRWTQADALEELLNDCYLFNFVRRLSGLGALLQNQDNIEGVIFRNIRNFLFEKQKRHDPVGYRVFRVLRSAIRQSISAQTLYVLDGQANIENGTILGWSLDAGWRRARPVDLRAPADLWSNELLPELVASRGSKLEQVVNRLCSFLADLASLEFEAFRFKDLVDPLKSNVRKKWSAVWVTAQGEVALEDGSDGLASLVRLIRPSSGFEERDLFQSLLICVAGSLDRLETRQKTREYLERLWVFLRNHAAEEGLPVHDEPVRTGGIPAQRKIAVLLGIPRYRIPGLRGTLGDLIETCKAAGQSENKTV